MNRHATEPIGTIRQVYDGALYPDVAVNTFRNIDRLFPTRAVRRGREVHDIPEAGVELENFQFRSGDEEYDLYDYLAIGRVTGLLVTRGGRKVFEKYFLGNDKDTRWMSMSVVKSVSSVLVGAAIKDGYIKSIDDEVTAYLKPLAGSAYEGVTVRQLLQMTSGVKWNETYTDRNSDRRRMLEAQIGQKPGTILELMASLPREAAPGTRWNYSTGETHVVGALVRAATGMHVADYLSEKIWAKFGMERDASWWLESPDGLEVGGSGLFATLRDYARFGLFLLNDGTAGGENVLPSGFIEEASTPKTVDGEKVDYGYMLWPMRDGAYTAAGIFGQFVYVHPGRDVVIAMWSAHPKPQHRSGIDKYDFLAALAEAAP